MQRLMILVFDLDDTLYPELTYVKSGFRVVAQYLEEAYSIPAADSYYIMERELAENGRGKVFDVVLSAHGIHTRKNVERCLKEYRFHNPEISLYEDACRALEKYKDNAKYLVTDGNKITQSKKVEALGLGVLFKRVFITHRYGVRNAKPNPYCFLKICKLEAAQPQEIVYVGDNPNKDFIEIKKLGFKTVRVRRGMFKDLTLTEDYEADVCINDLDEIDFNKL